MKKPKVPGEAGDEPAVTGVDPVIDAESGQGSDAPAEPMQRPREGGSYVRDRATGKLTKQEG